MHSSEDDFIITIIILKKPNKNGVQIRSKAKREDFYSQSKERRMRSTSLFHPLTRSPPPNPVSSTRTIEENVVLVHVDVRLSIHRV